MNILKIKSIVCQILAPNSIEFNHLYLFASLIVALIILVFITSGNSVSLVTMVNGVNG